MAQSRRARWDDVPAPLRAEIEDILGSRVVSAASQPRGFSSGSADRVVLKNGGRAFVKTIERSRNDGTFGLHAREALVARALPPTAPAPALRAGLERDGWMLLAFDDIDGRHPHQGDADGVLDALARVTAEPWGGGIALPALSDELTPDADSWNRLGATGAIATLDDWVVAASDRLADAARRAPGAVAGDRLVHLDCRADNILIDAHSAAWLVDWPWASTGTAWFDALTYLLDLLVEDPAAEVDPLLRHPVFATATDAAIDAVLAAVAGSWIERSREPAPPDLPTLRAFQRREADAALAWLRRRWDAPAPAQR